MGLSGRRLAGEAAGRALVPRAGWRPPAAAGQGILGLEGAWRVEIIRHGEGGLVSETPRLDSAGEDADSGRCLTVPLNPGSGFAGVATPLK